MSTPATRWAALRRRSDRGASVTIGVAIWLPVVLVVILVGLVGYTSWALAQEVAQGAAEIGAQQAALSPASAERGEQAARAYLAAHGGSDGQVSVSIDGGVATVTVTAPAGGVLGGTLPDVYGQAAAAVEPTP